MHLVPRAEMEALAKLTPSPRDPAADARAERAFLHAAGLEATQVVSVVIFTAALLWWLLDPFIFADEPVVRARFVWLRGGTAAAQVLAIAGVAWAPFARRVGVGWAIACMLGNAAWIGYHLGALGGANTPWFHFTYLFAMIPVAVPMRLGPRIFAAVGATLCLTGGFFAHRPEGLHGDFTDVTLSFSMFTTVLGVLTGHLATLATLARHRQTEALRRLTSTLEQRVSQQTAELRALAEHLELAREAERAHIARELHDELGQELTALRFSVNLARQRFARDPSLIGQNLADIEGFVARTHETVRHLVADLRPRALAELGLEAGLAWLVERARSQSGLEVVLAVSGDLDALSEARAAVAFRVVQESLTNVQRHAQAGRAWVTVTRQGDTIALEVRDDGQGIDLGDRPSGHGIVGMRERLRAVGGTLAVTRSPDGGTRVAATLPVHSLGTTAPKLQALCP